MVPDRNGGRTSLCWRFKPEDGDGLKDHDGDDVSPRLVCAQVTKLFADVASALTKDGLKEAQDPGPPS